MNRRIFSAAVMAGLLVAQAPVHAACSTSATNVAFGTYVPTSGSPKDSTGTVTVSCTTLIGLLISYTIKLNAGDSGSFAQRYMILGANHLNYNLYTDLLHTQIWGDGSGGTFTVTDGYLLNIGTTSRNYTVYGRIPASQNVAAGSYSDLITVTVTY